MDAGLCPYYKRFIFCLPNITRSIMRGGKAMIIKWVDGHYEIVSADNGQFIQSADTWEEALDDMKELSQESV